MKSRKICSHTVSSDGKAYHRAIRQPQCVISLNWPNSDLQPARIWPETTQKQTDHQTGVQSLTGYWVWAARMHGCFPPAAGDQVAADLWNARGKDVGTSSQLGCPATTVVPRVSGSGKPPTVHIRGQLVPDLQPLFPNLLSLWRMCRRMSENAALIQNFIVCIRPPLTGKIHDLNNWWVNP